MLDDLHEAKYTRPSDFSRCTKDERSEYLRIGLSFGFFMNACRKVPSAAKSDRSSYLSVSEGTMMCLDKNKTFELEGYYPDWIIYTEASAS